MRTLQFSQADIHKGNLVLVNHSHPVKWDTPERQLAPLPSNAPQIFLEQGAAKMLVKAITFISGECEIIPVSGYRTMQEQQELYTTSLYENGVEFTRKYVAAPGCSEHQTGLAIDLSARDAHIDLIRPNFPYDGICGQFREHSIQYGFIERYPAGREQITQISHEPWHFRYVGYPHSQAMAEYALTLEEYIDYLKQFRYEEKHLQFKSHWYNFEILYLPILENKDTDIKIPEGIPFQVSGNNEDGVIITLWKEWQ